MDKGHKRFIGIYRNGESIVVYAHDKDEATEKCKNSGWKLWKVLRLP